MGAGEEASASRPWGVWFKLSIMISKSCWENYNKLYKTFFSFRFRKPLCYRVDQSFSLAYFKLNDSIMLMTIIRTVDEVISMWRWEYFRHHSSFSTFYELRLSPHQVFDTRHRRSSVAVLIQVFKSLLSSPPSKICCKRAYHVSRFPTIFSCVGVISRCLLILSYLDNWHLVGSVIKRRLVWPVQLVDRWTGPVIGPSY